MTQPDWPTVTLCIPTFRRPQGLQKLLEHVGLLTYPGKLSVLVVENDDAGRAGEAVVRAVMRGFRFPLRCIVEPKRGQTYAYNRAFVSACGELQPEYVAVLDDDEYPQPGWLTALVEAAVANQADIVGGPVFPVFENPDHWLSASGLYEPRRYPSGRVDMIYGAGNMLISRDVLAQYLDEPFSNAFAFTGGSDYDFFTRCRQDRRSFAWADEAHVLETVPRSRISIAWLLRRGFRNGTDRTRIDRKFARGIGGAVRRWLKGAGLVAYGMASLPLALFRGRCAAVGSLIEAARGAGRIAAEFGILYEEYR